MVPIRNAMYAVKNNLNKEEKPVMKVIDLSFNHEFIGYLYGKGSPFAEKFNKMMLRMVESAVFPDRELNKIQLHDLKDVFKNETDDVIIKTTLVILLFGYVLSTSIFIYEMISYSIISKMKNNRRRYKRKINVKNKRRKGRLVQVRERENSVVYEIIDYYNLFYP